MINSINLNAKSDIIGVLASALCFVHCMAAPLLFVAHASAVGVSESHPWWWGTLDLVFLTVSFIAVYWSARNTSKRWMRFMLWSSWLLLAFVVINEKVSIIALAEESIYAPTAALVFLHIYNRRYYHCPVEECNVD